MLYNFHCPIWHVEKNTSSMAVPGVNTWDFISNKYWISEYQQFMHMLTHKLCTHLIKFNGCIIRPFWYGTMTKVTKFQNNKNSQFKVSIIAASKKEPTIHLWNMTIQNTWYKKVISDMSEYKSFQRKLMGKTYLMYNARRKGRNKHEMSFEFICIFWQVYNLCVPCHFLRLIVNIGAIFGRDWQRILVSFTLEEITITALQNSHSLIFSPWTILISLKYKV